MRRIAVIIATLLLALATATPALADSLQVGSALDQRVDHGAADATGLSADNRRAHAPLHPTSAGCSWLLVHNSGPEQRLTNVMKNIHSRGSTAEAVLREGATGLPTGGKYHFVKAAESAQALNKLIDSGQLMGRHLDRAIYERDQLISTLLASGIRP